MTDRQRRNVARPEVRVGLPTMPTRIRVTSEVLRSEAAFAGAQAAQQKPNICEQANRAFERLGRDSDLRAADSALDPPARPTGYTIASFETHEKTLAVLHELVAELELRLAWVLNSSAPDPPDNAREARLFSCQLAVWMGDLTTTLAEAIGALRNLISRLEL